MFSFPVAYLNSNNGSAILAFGEGPMLSLSSVDGIEQIDDFIEAHSKAYVFMALSYDLKNDLEELESRNTDRMHFPKLILWSPKYVIRVEDENMRYLFGTPSAKSEIFIEDFFLSAKKTSFPSLNCNFLPRTLKEEYLKHVNELKHEIKQGNIYEVNYCQEYFAENVTIDNPLDVYNKLNEITKAPYSSLFSIEEFTIFSGSPESYIRKEKNHLVSSPIKGTRKRGESKDEDERLKRELKEDKKERAENIMIVDLVRNDFSKIAKKNSVHVDELLEIYSFETVHQMISSISCDLDEEIKFSQIIDATFPMGSMTGAPKISAMELIEKHEDFKRGIYSGSIGYRAPNGDLDFNVIIRSLVYNSKENYLSCAVGGAITIDSSAESEYEECLVKVKVILDKMNE